MPDVICLGELLIDFVSTRKGIRLADSPAFEKKPGGAPANVAVGLAKLGVSSGFVGKVGNDAFGHFLRDTLAAEGVDVSHLATTDAARTTLAFVSLTKDGTPDFAFYRNPGADMLLSERDIAAAYHSKARALHFGSISLADPGPKAATLKAIAVARKSGQIISYDPNYRPALWKSPAAARREILMGFQHADVAKVSDQEWEFITGTSDLEKGAHALLKRGVKILVVSRGPEGCWFTTGRHSAFVPGYKVKVAETTGAGDGFVAALLHGILGEWPKPDELADFQPDWLVRICDFANAVGALTCTKVGAIPALPTRAAALRFLRLGGFSEGDGKGLIRVFPAHSAKVERLGAIIEQLVKGLTWRRGAEPTKSDAAALWPLTDEGFGLTCDLIHMLTYAVQPSASARRWLEKQHLPEEVPDWPDRVRKLPQDEREIFWARQHVRACVKKLKRLWPLVNRQATAHNLPRLHAALRELLCPFTHMEGHLYPDSGCCIA